ncbi:hypothetical protein A1O1_04650 [Capronia coronata CBS 617.96]|uniref:Uncharacterized protein n=1 Tax=Capronia coronata CBS 617.96 TaxID=1182541 RepID=W9YDG5_9EURO|nr:uncharacterized protein A1O1_04650 [Capronia coronata CBS 617.96]EXJ87725.1 hypothetical protein A1O1_04650 [Capronia coronata CBS 617.96]
MTSQPLSLDNALHTTSKRLSAVVQICEVPVTSPTVEWPDATAHGLVEVVGNVGSESLDKSRALWAGLNLDRPRIGEGQLTKKRPSRPRIRRRSSSSSVEGEFVEGQDYCRQRLPSYKTLSQSRSVDNAASFPRKDDWRRPGHNGHAATTTRNPPSTGIPIPRASPLGAFAPQPWIQSYPLTAQSLSTSCGVVAPLTPPEDLDAFDWDTPLHLSPEEGVRTVMNVNDRSSRQHHNQARANSTSRPSGIQMPDRSNMNEDEANRSNWLGRACQQLVLALGDASNQQQLQMVVQALPSQAKSSNARPVFEKVVEVVQGRFTSPPYITITHAISQVISMDEVPASPPATPNTNHSSDDYFQDQTVFTHAAVVPAYHSRPQPPAGPNPRSTNIIAAPSSIHLSILERYLPPTTAQEVDDFFTLSRRSYLADRLLELSANNGSLLLVYPTKVGGSVFASKYIGPVIEPFLRQFVLLNSLYMELAIELGQMAGVAGMKSFEEIQKLLQNMCRDLGQRAPSWGLPSRYELVHAETAEVVLDGTLWKEWYIEQEQPRLRQNLVDYHKAGGRMPARHGQIEITPGMLAREVVEGIRHSREPAGNAGIEVGVFVIRRTLV